MAASEKLIIRAELEAKRVQRELAKIEKQAAKIGKTLNSGLGGTGGGAAGKARALGSGLSAATVKADEFSKSLEASNARVIAFGASAGVIVGVERALKSMVASAVKVEKAMADVNVVMNASVKTLEQFGKGMFRVAKETAQGFDTVAEAATELARQGLGMEKTLNRTKDALILTRLTGMNAADSVKSLTAAVNSFNKEGVTSAQVVNRMAKVDAAFAVSSEDLAKAVSRVGSSAVDAGVSLNQLMAITTAVQQKTARGGAVIGNAFKTIFTRIQRSDVQKTLRDMGVAVTDSNGKMLDAITILENLSGSYSRLAKAEQAAVGEQVAGVFQINILKAAMSDLVQKNSQYAQALRTANTATDEAYVRNQQLNQTLDALANKTLANLTQAGANIGGATLEPAIRKLLNGVNATIESFGEGGQFERLGETLGKGLMTGVGAFISGPGILLAGVAIGKLVANLAKFAKTAFKEFMGLNKATQSRLALQETITSLLIKEPQLINKVKSSENGLLDLEQQILNTVKQQNAERRRAALIAKSLARSLGGRGVVTGPKGTVAPGAAGGFIPNFANPNSERAAAAAGGYRAGAIRTMNQPGSGSVMYNSAETVKRFPGMTQSAIMPPKGSPAGAGYKAAFSAAHGFNPYAGSGFIPNFNPAAAATFRRQKTESMGLAPGKRGDVVNLDLTVPSNKKDMGIITETGSATTPIQFSQNIMNPKAGIPALSKLMSQWRGADGRRVGSAQLRVSGIPVVPIFPIAGENVQGKGGKGPTKPDSYLQGSLNKYSKKLSKEMFGTTDVARDFDVDALSRGTMGDIFEEGVRVAVGGARNDDRLAAFDYMGKKYANTRLIGFFNRQGRSANLNPTKSKIEAKIGEEAAISGNIPRKMINDDMVGYDKKEILQLFKDEFSTLTAAKGKRGKMAMAASGFVPNFSGLSSAVGREMAAGVPASSIRVGSSPALRSAGNPNGIGVYNTFHEPGGLNQGIARSRSMGINPKTHGAAGGFVPNFMVSDAVIKRAEEKVAKLQAEAGKDQMKAGKGMGAAADKMMMASIGISMLTSGAASSMGAGPQLQGGINAFSNIGTSAMMGFSMGGPIGALIGGGLGAVTSMGDFSMAFGEAGRQAALQETLDSINEITGAMSTLGSVLDSMSTLQDDTPAKRLEKLNKLQLQHEKVLESLAGDEEHVVKARESYMKRIGGKGIFEGKKFSDFSGEDLIDLQSRMEAEQVRIEQEIAIGNRFSAFNRRATGTGDSVRALTRDIFKPGIQQSIADVNIGGLQGVDIIKDIISGMEQFGGSAIAPLREGGDASGQGKNRLSNFIKMGPQLTRFRELMKASGERVFAEQIDEVLKNLQNIDPKFLTKGSLAALDRGDYNQTNIAREGSGRDISPQNLLTQLKLMSRIVQEGKKIIPLFADPEFFRATELPPVDIMGPQAGAGDVRAARTAARLKNERIGRGRRFGSDRELGRIKRAGATSAAERANANRMLQFQFAGDDLINQQATIQRQGVLDKAFQAEDELREKQKSKLDAEEIKLREKALGDLEKVKADEFEDRIANIKSLEEFTEKSKNLRGEAIQTELDKYTEIENTQGALTTAEEARVNYLTELLSKEKAINAETEHLNEERNKSTKNQTDIIDENAETLIEMRKRMLEFNAVAEDLKISDDFTRASSRASGLQSQRNRGFGISGQELAAARTDARRAQIRLEGASAANPGQAFRDAFSYNEIDAVLEFEEGVVNVAKNMQSSFADAFQSIASGAASAGDAFAGMAQSILDSISKMSFDMASKMMFQSMGFARGGLVKGYQSGGLVTGGSGHKDDVLTAMQGGEFVIRKSAVNKLGVDTLNAINGYATGGKTKGPGMGKMLAIGAGAAALGGILRGGGQSAGPKPLPSQDYGFGRSKLGFLGGPDPDARGADRIGAGGGAASVSLNKAFVYYRRDPKTGALISEAARPTEGRFEVSDRLSLIGRLSEGDPQTARMFEKEQRMSKYQQYLATETQRRKDAVDAVKRKKRGNLIQAYASAAMLIGGAKFMGGGNGGGGSEAFMVGADDAMGPGLNEFQTNYGSGVRTVATGGGVGGGLARVMGGEYIMSPSAVRTHGVNVMSELNRGNLPGYAGGGLVGNQGGASGAAMGGIGDTTNNVKININVDKSGKTEATAEATEQKSTGQERDDIQETEKNKELGKILQGVVLQEIVKQQRPGGLLQQTGQKTSR